MCANKCYLLFLFFTLLIGFGLGYFWSSVNSTDRSVSSVAPQLLDEAESLAPVVELQPPQEHFVRVATDVNGKALTLDTAITEYRNPNSDSPSISLIGAVHVADAAYFSKLNTEFERYDSLLYELVAPQGTRPTRGQTRDSNFLSSFQHTLADYLSVEHQVDHIDYHRTNFVHADLSPEDLLEEGRKRGESQLTLVLGLMADVLRASNLEEQSQRKNPDLPTSTSALPKNLPELLQWLSNPMQVRQDAATAMASDDFFEKSMSFATLMPYLIDLRNAAAIEVLRAELAAGKQNIGIFYGAAHLPDFEERLYQDFGFHRVETRWIEAWDLSKPLPAQSPVQLMLKIIRGMGQSR